MQMKKTLQTQERERNRLLDDDDDDEVGMITESRNLTIQISYVISVYSLKEQNVKRNGCQVFCYRE
jgi:hypothetical protein